MRRNDFEEMVTAKLEVALCRLECLERKMEEMMGAIKDFADKMKQHNDAVDKAVDDLTGDIQTLNDKITALQNSQGTLSAGDQTLLDELEQRGAALQTKIEALDAMTPPPQPNVPPSA